MSDHKHGVYYYPDLTLSRDLQFFEKVFEYTLNLEKLLIQDRDVFEDLHLGSDMNILVRSTGYLLQYLRGELTRTSMFRKVYLNDKEVK